MFPLVLLPISFVVKGMDLPPLVCTHAELRPKFPQVSFNSRLVVFLSCAREWSWVEGNGFGVFG